MIKERDIVKCVIFTILTCGIYGIYWFITLTDDVAYLSEDVEFKGGMSFLFTIITCGIYSFFWCYRLGKDISYAQEKHGKRVNDNGVLYIILQLFGLSIVTYGLAQNDINDLVRNK